MNRSEFRQLAQDRISDATALLTASRWSGAYYLAGYAVECALKACILRLVEETGIIFEDKKFVERCWTHDIEGLLKEANLTLTRDLALSSSTTFATNWNLVKDWKENARYYQKTEHQARELVEAVSDHADGVLPWITKHW